MRLGILIFAFALLAILFILTRNFWKTAEQKKCTSCRGMLTDFKIIIADENGTKVYCSPYCIEQGLKDAEKTES